MSTWEVAKVKPTPRTARSAVARASSTCPPVNSPGKCRFGWNARNSHRYSRRNPPIGASIATIDVEICAAASVDTRSRFARDARRPVHHCRIERVSRPVDAGPIRSSVPPVHHFRLVWAPGRRLLAPFVLGLVVQTLTGCTLLGYAVGSAQTPASHSVAAKDVQVIPVGTDVEVFYAPSPTEQVPAGSGASLAASPARPTAELSMVTGTYRGTRAGKVVLDHEVSRLDAGGAPFGSALSGPVETKRDTVPLDQVSRIRTVPSPGPRIVGTLIGAAVDVAIVVAYASAVRNIQ